MSLSDSSSFTAPARPIRPTRSIPPLPPLVTGSDEPLIDDDNQDQHQGQPQESPVQVAHPTPAHEHTDLTPVRAHYLKKSLVQLQFRNEINAITSHSSISTDTLSFLGPPFSPPQKDANPYLDLPFLRYIFRQFVLTFPFMASAPKDFYSEKLQPFVASALSRNISSSSVLDDQDSKQFNTEMGTSKKLLAKLERNVAMFVGAAIRLVEPEQVVRLNQSDLQRLETLAKKRVVKKSKTKLVFEVNVIGVRTVVDKGRMRSRAHEEFIIRTRRSDLSDVFVARRYGDFRTLANELQKAHPSEQVRQPPPKDRTSVVVNPTSPTSNHYTNGDLSLPNIPQSPSQAGLAASRLAREKNRLTLRSYLHSLLAASTFASSPVIRSFLLSGPITLTQTELEDTQRREEADRLREEGRQNFAKEIAGRVETLREAVKNVKGDIMGKDGLSQIFATVKVTPAVRDLPPNYQAVLEWARISMASTVFHQFVASDNASESFANLKRIHGLMPYFLLKTTLKISNPISMIRGVMDLFLAQPFGGRSLLQRMFTSSLTEEVKALENDIEAVKNKIEDPIVCAKIRQFVYAPREIQDFYKLEAASEKLHLMTVVLRALEEPILTSPQMQRLARSQRAHHAYMKHRASLADSDDDDGPQDEDAWFIEDLKVLTYLYSRLRDREQLIALIFEGFTADLLKDIITIFYAPLAQVYRAASIADSLNDLQNFMNDLIKTVEQAEELGQMDSHRTVQVFIDLIGRHEQSFYHFVHKVHSKGETLFTGLMHWIELFLTVVREGLGSPTSLEYLLPHAGKARDDILAEIDQVALYHYKLKVAYESKIRLRFERTQGREDDADIEDEVTQVLVNGVVGAMEFGELMHGDVDDLAAEETDESSSDGYDSSDFESTEVSEGSSIESQQESLEEGLPARHPTSAPNRHAQSRPPGRSQTFQTNSSPPPPRPMDRVQTFQAGQTPLRPPAPAHIEPTRKRSLSLRSSKSLLFRRNAPVPDLPSMPKSASIELPTKALSPSLSSFSLTGKPSTPTSALRMGFEPSHSQSLLSKLSPETSTSRLSRDSSSRNSHDSLPPRTRQRKRTTPTLKPPELQQIPQLLPVFVEMIRPLLRPRLPTTDMTTSSHQ